MILAQYNGGNSIFYSQDGNWIVRIRDESWTGMLANLIEHYRDRTYDARPPEGVGTLRYIDSPVLRKLLEQNGQLVST